MTAKGLLVIDMSTIRPDTARAVAEAARARGVRFRALLTLIEDLSGRGGARSPG
jgi:hypothetical protein